MSNIFPNSACILRRLGAIAALLLGVFVFTPAWAGAGHDCAPVGSLPGYPTNGDQVNRTYDQETFTTDNGNVTVAGRLCQQNYEQKSGAQPMSELERQMNYRAQLEQLGATIMHAGDEDTVAKLSKDGHDTWIKVGTWNGDIYVTVLEVQPFKQSFIDTPSGGDYAPLGHMANYVVDGTPKKENFDQDTFTIKDGDSGSKQVKVQGGLYQVDYVLKPGAQMYTPLEVMTNYTNALKKLGAEILYTKDDGLDARLDKNGQAVWISLWVWNTKIEEHVIEEKAFQASIKPAQASALKAALDKDGHVALYINFDFDKATLRPDAAPVIAQVVALLKGNADLKLSVVGNTDNVGAHDYNVQLSQQRAATVVAELVKAGIAPARLTSAGDGPDKPIADNATTEGRAKNRRVELVKV